MSNLITVYLLDLFVFTLLGGIAGTLAWFLISRHQPLTSTAEQPPLGVQGVIVLGIVGALVGGMISWIFWPAVDGAFHLAGLLASIVGALTLLWPYSLLAGSNRA